MKKNEFLDIEEKEIIESFEKGEFVSVSNLEERKKELKQSFKKTINSRRPINIRVLETDIHKLKTKAIEEGLPYQTLISKVLHDYTTGKLISK
ncbi:MAG: antitoxin [Candidatus Gracilibacteria bacterium]|nr:antitoxin [Candidatus Gracilibacteria bacterium]